MYSIPLTLSRHRDFTRPCLDSPVPGHPIAGAAGSRAVTADGAPAHVHERTPAGRRGAQAGRGRLALGEQHGQGQAGGGEKPLQAYTVEQVAKMLHVGRDKVYYLLRTGQLRSLKIGKLRRITEQQLAEFIASLDDARTS